MMRNPIVAAAAAILAVAIIVASPAVALAEAPHTTAFLGVHFQNDNEMYEPTSDAERARIETVEEIFTSKLAESGKYRMSVLPPGMKARVAAGQAPGECGGCEVDYGKEMSAEWVAWINVQKVSNLILNMNVYIADVRTNKMVFVRSVDIRNNSDEGWERAINYLLKNYLLPGVS
jgi:hypothetical protein